MRHTTVRSMLVASLALAACQDPSTDKADDSASTPAPIEPETAAPLQAGAAHDVAIIAKTAVLGFRDSGGAFSAGYRTHDALVRDGITELTPHHVTDDGTRITGGAMTLETGFVQRGDGTDLGGAAKASLVNGAVQIQRGAATETIANRDDGIEQAWRFDAEPAGDGDLAIGVSVTGQTLVATTATGLHFASDAGLGFRISNATWVDALGKETDIPARFVDGHAVFTVPASVLADTAYPATLDPTVSAEVAVDSPVNGGQNPGSVPAVAFDGTNFLVVFADDRLGTGEDIYATRVSAAGAVLDATNIKVGSAAGVQTNPAVVYAGGRYVVAWEDYKVTGGTSADIAAATVTPAGVVASLGAVAATTGNETQPKLAASGTGALLAWTTDGTSVSASLLGTTFGAPFTVATGTVTDPAVAANPAGNYLVAWSDGTTTAADVKGQFVTAAGALSGAAFPIANGAGRQYQPSATFDGTNYALAWTQNSAGINLFAGRVSPAGAQLDTATGIAISTAANTQQRTAIACPSTGCLVIWQDQRAQATTAADIFAQLLTPAFALSGANFVVSNPTQNQVRPGLAFGPAGFLAAWQDRRDATSDAIFAARITTAGGVQDTTGFLVERGNNKETTLTIGRTGITHGVFWTDSRNGSTDIDLVRFRSTAATKLDTTAISVSSAALSQSAPAATQGSSGNMFVAWMDTRGGVARDIYGSRVNDAGTVLDPNGIAISTATGDQISPDAASKLDGSAVLVVWQDARNSGTTGYDIYGALLDGSGAIVANDIVICNATGEQNRPAVAFDSKNNQFVVVWSDQRVATDADVYAARVNLAGTVLDANGVRITSATKGQLQPDIAFSNTNNSLLAVWEDRRSDSTGDIYGTRLTAGSALTVLDPNGIAIAATASVAQNSPSVGHIGGTFLVAWSDSRNLATTGTDIWTTQVTTTGFVDPAFVLSANPEDESNPIVGDTGRPGYTRVGYQRLRPDLGTIRVETRFVGVTGGNGQSCTSNGGCATGFCVDNKCCDAACGGANTTDCQGCAYSITGQADGVCAPARALYVCRNYADTFCDLIERCDGTSTDCPPNIGRRQGVACTKAGGGTGTCPANDISGAPHVCQ